MASDSHKKHFITGLLGNKKTIMQLILIKDVDNLGGKDELLNVKNGYARNFLFPTKQAIEAIPSNLKQLEERLKVKAKKEAAAAIAAREATLVAEEAQRQKEIEM